MKILPTYIMGSYFSTNCYHFDEESKEVNKQILSQLKIVLINQKKIQRSINLITGCEEDETCSDESFADLTTLLKINEPGEKKKN